MDGMVGTLRSKFVVLRPVLDERARRPWAATGVSGKTRKSGTAWQFSGAKTRVDNDMRGVRSGADSRRQVHGLGTVS